MPDAEVKFPLGDTIRIVEHAKSTTMNVSKRGKIGPYPLLPEIRGCFDHVVLHDAGKPDTDGSLPTQGVHALLNGIENSGWIGRIGVFLLDEVADKGATGGIEDTHTKATASNVYAQRSQSSTAPVFRLKDGVDQRWKGITVGMWRNNIGRRSYG